MFDVGHGDCVLLIDGTDKGILVDCGSQRPRLCFKTPRFIENLLTFENRCGLVISHYHWDHYSLFRHFRSPELLFSNFYLPDLPIIGPGKEASLAIMDFMKLSIFADFSHYRILPEVITKTRIPIVFCRRGVVFHEANLPFKVFWPDLRHPVLGTEEVRRKAKTVREIVEPIMDRFDISKPSRHGDDYSIKRFFRDLEVEEIRYRQLAEEAKEEICRILERIEKTFQNLANLFSIAFRTHYKRKNRFLFLGDLLGNALDQISIPGTGVYDCIKAAHHGTEYGSALDDIATQFLLVSRNEGYRKINRIHDGYSHKIRYRMLLSTGFLGDCCIC